jgi:glycerol uptake facilitator protein
MAEKFLAEIFGTAMLILLGDGVVAGVVLSKTKAQNSGWIVITLAWGLAVYCGVVIAGPISGAHLNPAVTLGLAVMHSLNGNAGIPWDQVPVYVVGEFIGAMIGATLVAIHYWDHFKATEDQGLKLAVFCTAPAIRNYGLNFVGEAIGTFVLLFVIFSFGHNGSASGLASLGALPVALLIVVIGLSLGPTTGYAINPARDLGPRIMHAILPIPGKGGSDWEYSWVPVLGPLVGGSLAAIVYYFGFTNYILVNMPH